MSTTTTAELTGRDLDRAVATVLGWFDFRDIDRELYAMPPEYGEGVRRRVPAYSADFSGMERIIDWLTANAPTYGQGTWLRKGREFIDDLSASVIDEDRTKMGVVFTSPHDDVDYWTAGYALFDDVNAIEAAAPTLPEAAARLLVAWDAVKKERGWV
jgi:hypothetical protein